MEKRRAYLYDPSAVVPKTTAWRYHKRFAANSVSGQNVLKKKGRIIIEKVVEFLSQLCGDGRKSMML